MYYDNELTEKAIKLYTREPGVSQPGNDSETRELNGKTYVILRNINGVLAVYEVKGKDHLHRLSEWPKELEVF